MQRHSDELFQFSYRIFKIEYIIIKLLLFALSLYGLYQFAEQHFHFHKGLNPPSTFSSPIATRTCEG